MRKIFTLVVMALMTLGANALEQEDILSKFSGLWGGDEESMVVNDDNSITYNGKAWGGLSAWFGTYDWTPYTSVTLEFAEATTMQIQLLAGNAVQGASAGVTKLTCSFDGIDMSSCQQIVLQLGAKGSVTITKAYLSKAVDYQAEGASIEFDQWGSILASAFEGYSDDAKVEFLVEATG